MTSINKLGLIFLFFSYCVLLQASDSRYGLYSKDNKPFSLLDLKTKALVEGPYVEIEYTQIYKNPYDIALETEFYFPRTETSIFYKFQATFQNQAVVGQIQEKQKAKEAYELNKQKGNTVAYAERNTLSPDLMKILVGNIPSQESVEITFSIIQPLDVIANKFWGFTLPTVVTERYAPSSVDPTKMPNIVNVDAKQSLYKDWKVLVEVKSNTLFSSILNPSHKLKPELTETSSSPTSKVYKAQWNVTLLPNKDFVVYFRSQEMEQPSTIVAAHPKFSDDYVLMVNFIPELNNLDIEVARKLLEISEDGLIKLKEVVFNEDTENAKGEFIFVIDRSGSMDGQRIINLKQALDKFLQVLPKDSFFNIISFGSDYSSYKHQSVRNTAENIQEAKAWISTIEANMGGTEILRPLQYVSELPLLAGYPRTVMVLTDGDVFNPNDVINLVRNSPRMRVCGVGIGYGASEYLIKNLAKAGRCASQFVLDGEDVGDKAIYMIKAAVSRYLEDINFNIQCFNENQDQVFSQKEKTDLLLKDEPFKRWVYLQNVPGIRRCTVELDYYNSMKNERLMKKLEIDDFMTAESTETWHKVAYDAKIKDLDLLVKSTESHYYRNSNSNDLKSQIVDISTKYQVMSDYTAFLAVIQENTVDSETQRVKTLIPNINSVDYASQTYDEDVAMEESLSRLDTNIHTKLAAFAPSSAPSSDEDGDGFAGYAFSIDVVSTLQFDCAESLDAGSFEPLVRGSPTTNNEINQLDLMFEASGADLDTPIIPEMTASADPIQEKANVPQQKFSNVLNVGFMNLLIVLIMFLFM